MQRPAVGWHTRGEQRKRPCGLSLPARRMGPRNEELHRRGRKSKLGSRHNNYHRSGEYKTRVNGARDDLQAALFSLKLSLRRCLGVIGRTEANMGEKLFEMEMCMCFF